MKRLLPYTLLGILLAILPFGEQPHLVQKIQLLTNGNLHQAKDWFDLLLHSSGLFGAIVYGVFLFIKKNTP